MKTRNVLLVIFCVYSLMSCSIPATEKIIDESIVVTQYNTQGVFTEADASLGTYRLYVGEYQTWQVLDLSTYFDGRAIVRLEFEATDGENTEYCNLEFREVGSSHGPETVSVYRGVPIKTDYVEMLTNSDGQLEWKSNYSWPAIRWIDVEFTIVCYWN